MASDQGHMEVVQYLVETAKAEVAAKNVSAAKVAPLLCVCVGVVGLTAFVSHG